MLAYAFIKGASENGHNVEKVALYNRKIEFCRGCLICQKKGKCILNDDADEIVKKMIEADIIVFATPIYFYEMSGQMKTLIDRTKPLFVQDYKFRDIYLIATCADKQENSIDGAIKGVIKGLGIDQYGDVKNHEDIMKKAYLLLKSIE